MSFTLFFPSQGRDGAYTDLVEEHEVYEAILEETRKAISDMGSAGYELVWPDNIDVSRINDMPPNEQETAVLRAHEAGIEQATRLAAPEIFKELWVRYRTDKLLNEDVAINDTMYTTLPDGTIIALADERDDDGNSDG